MSEEYWITYGLYPQIWIVWEKTCHLAHLKGKDGLGTNKLRLRHVPE